MSNQKRIASEWNKFEKAVMPPNAPAVQRKEMRRAFYAGVWAMFQVAKELGEDSVSEEEGVKTLEEIEAECMEFMKQVRSKSA